MYILFAFLCCSDKFKFPDVTPTGKTDAMAEDQVISCAITGLAETESASVTWKDNTGASVPTNDAATYVVDPGTASGGAQTTQLTIKKAKLITLPSSFSFVCSVTSGKHSSSGPFDTSVAVTLAFGKFSVYVNHSRMKVCANSSAYLIDMYI